MSFRLKNLTIFALILALKCNQNNSIKLTNSDATYLEASPCPRLFTYEGINPEEPDRWYGILTLLSDSDLTGVWIRIVFDKPIIKLGNWFGEVKKRGETDYLVKNSEFNLKAHTTKIIRIFVKFNTNDTPPQLQQFRINGKTVCPEEVATTTPSTTTLRLFTSEDDDPLFIATPAVTHPTSTESNTAFISEHRPPILSHGNDYPVHNTDESLENVCGTVAEYKHNERSNEQVAHKGQFPWHAALYYTKGVTIVYLCGATLISKYHLITVAHCVISKHKLQAPLNPELIIVYLGKYYVKHWAHEPTQTLYVSDIITHPEFVSETYNNDIALLKLVYPADITEVVRPVCLWQESQDFNYVANRQGTVVGWGFDENGKIEDALMYVRMIIRENEACVATFANYTIRFQSNNLFCANFVDDTMECVGDSGGGMVYPSLSANNSKSVWQLRGLVTYSVVLQHQFNCDPSRYVVFTDVAKYVDWIKESMKI